MRVTAETRESTRRKILEAAQELFRSVGFEATSTREIAQAAGIAAGTLFNYFPTKESLATTLVVESQTRAARRVLNESYESLEEALFAHIAAGLRLLKPHRAYLTPVLETALSPLADASGAEPGSALRTGHLEKVVEIARRYQLDAALSPVALQMYWTLYFGVLAFWARDSSPRQEDTLALLDQSLEMFVGWLRAAELSSSQPPSPCE